MLATISDELKELYRISTGVCKLWRNSRCPSFLKWILTLAVLYTLHLLLKFVFESISPLVLSLIATAIYHVFGQSQLLAFADLMQYLGTLYRLAHIVLTRYTSIRFRQAQNLLHNNVEHLKSTVANVAQNGTEILQAVVPAVMSLKPSFRLAAILPPTIPSRVLYCAGGSIVALLSIGLFTFVIRRTLGPFCKMVRSSLHFISLHISTFHTMSSELLSALAYRILELQYFCLVVMGKQIVDPQATMNSRISPPENDGNALRLNTIRQSYFNRMPLNQRLVLVALQSFQLFTLSVSVLPAVAVNLCTAIICATFSVVMRTLSFMMNLLIAIILPFLQAFYRVISAFVGFGHYCLVGMYNFGLSVRKSLSQVLFYCIAQLGIGLQTAIFCMSNLISAMCNFFAQQLKRVSVVFGWLAGTWEGVDEGGRMVGYGLVLLFTAVKRMLVAVIVGLWWLFFNPTIPARDYTG